MTTTKRCCLRFATLLAALISAAACLEFGFYDRTCPTAETIVQQTVAAAFTNNSGVAPALIRLHFHDCFVRVISTCAHKKSFEKYDDIKGFCIKILAS
jgi:peroxidase